MNKVNLSHEKYHILPVHYTTPSSNSNTFTCPLVKEEEIFTNLMKVIMTMKEDSSFLTPGGPGYHERFRWSFYEPFGIPQYSITDNCMKINYRTLFKRFNKRDNWQAYFRGVIGDNNILDNFFNNPPGTCVFNLFQEISTKYRRGRQPDSLFLIINWQSPYTINERNERIGYKIHFCVKEEYALYVLMKAMTIMNNRAKEKTKITGIEYLSNGKIITTFEDSKNTIRESGIRYALPTVVIYTYTDKADEVREILEEFIRAFPESEDIGLCELGNPERIPYGNIRINKLICFAKGDRGMKLKIVSQDIFDKDDKKRFGGKYIPLEKTIPPWILEMINKCKTSEEVNKRSQHFFGVNICDDTYSSITSENKCDIQPFCYLSPTVDCLDPNTIRGIEGLEPTNEYSSSPSSAQQPVTTGGRKPTRKIRKKRSRSQESKMTKKAQRGPKSPRKLNDPLRA